MAKPVHPGIHIRSILPPKLTVKKAAEMLGVGRPTLSNLLNGNASLSPDMATRIEKAFGEKRETLLQMQATYDEFQARGREKEIVVRTYAPGFMDVTAAQIEGWAQRHATRALLAVLLRRLVRSTGASLTTVDFPGHDNAQRHGWDGLTETDTATPWIPAGQAGWEFGCDKDPRQKAEGDYTARTGALSAAERKRMTFVFVTPHNWPKKREWADAKKAKGQWKDIRALDASDLEQWLEQSVPSQSWLAERIGLPTENVLSLDQCWEQWAGVTDPALPKEMFQGGVDVHCKSLTDWLAQPPVRPFIITADSQEEALAFLACAFERAGATPGKYYDRAIALKSADALTKAVRSSTDFIAILASSEAEAASAGFYKKQHTIIVRGQNAVEGEPDVSLDLLDDKTFKAALTAMGLPEEDHSRYERDSGQSATVLRRRLSKVPEIKFPAWAKDPTLARKLIPLGLAGVWDSQAPADQEILAALTGGQSHEQVESHVAELRNMEHPPVWLVGRYHGVVSKIDALYAIHGHITRADLEKFFKAAKEVLTEKDPALELPEDDRPFANIYDKKRKYSAALRKGMAETLVLLGAHGNNLFSKGSGTYVETAVALLVRSVLKPFSAETWASQRGDLPLYAEATPDEFLALVEDDLDSDSPQILELLKPAGSGIFSGCLRTGLLWALEILAWKPERLLRVATILARLSVDKIDDNWGNKPERSLGSIFRAWMPQTRATVDERCAALEALCRGKYKDVAWRLCVAQFDFRNTMGLYSSRPRWRNDAAGAGQIVTNGERYKFARKALDIALAWSTHDEKTLGDLVELLRGMEEEDQIKVGDLIKDWAASTADEKRKATLRECIRRSAFTRRGRKSGLSPQAQRLMRECYQLLEAKDLLVRHHWLFKKRWVEESFEEMEDFEGFDYKEREKRIGALRDAALREIWQAQGYDGVLRLCESSEAPGVIGFHLISGILAGAAAEDVVAKLVSESPNREWDHAGTCASGLLNGMTDEARRSLLVTLLKRFDAAGGHDALALKVRLLQCAPLCGVVWCLAEQQGPELAAEYWKAVHPSWARLADDETPELVERLLEAQRPRAAFFAAHLELKSLDTRLLVRLLTEAVTRRNEPPKHYLMEPHHISEAFEVLESRADITPLELGQLEFMYLQVLERAEHGIPNLERQLCESPDLFAQAITAVFKRNDGKEDPPDGQTPDSRSEMATHVWNLLHAIKRIPGTKNDDVIDAEELKVWITKVRAFCKEAGRKDVGDSTIGGLLAKCPAGADGVWPCEAMREALEETGTADIARGMSIGVYNGRGVVARGEGGAQERELAEKYRNWSKQLAFDAPFTSRLLESIARGYDKDAEWHDTDANIRKRLMY